MMVKNREDELFVQRLLDLSDMCKDRFSVQFTHFLDGREIRLAKDCLLRNAEDVLCVYFGGFDSAERKIAGLFPRDIYGFGFDEKDLFKMFEMSAVKVHGSGFSRFSHRDVLGAVLNLGIKREAVGDIYVEDDGKCAYICLENAAAGLVLSSLEFVARDKVRLSMVDVLSLPKIEKKYAVISGTIASQRLDCVLSLALNVSREKAKQIISSGLVNINHFEETRCDCNLCEGDIISVRGYGRFELCEYGGVTRKGRDRVTLHKMI